MTSGEFAGTTLTEMRKHWKLQDLLDAIDVLSYKRAISYAQHKKSQQKAPK